jgi:predicted phosphodiesterase
MTEVALKSVAALYDIHGNASAFEAAFKVVDAAGVDATLFGGDLALGPFPRMLLDAVMSFGPSSRSIRGNCDRFVVDAFDGRDLSRLPARVRHLMEWTANQLDTRHRDYLASLPETVTLNIDGMGDVLFCHATPRSDEEILTAALLKPACVP